MSLSTTHTYRLYDVSAEADEHGHYGLESFTDASYNEVIGEDELGESLTELADALFGQSGCSHYEITDDVVTGTNGKLCIDLDDNDRLEVRDIVAQINADPDESRIYVLVNATRTEHRWVTALSEGTVYSD